MKAGLKVGDVITQIGTRPVRRSSDVPGWAHFSRPGDSIEITLLRDGNRLKVSLTMAP